MSEACMNLAFQSVFVTAPVPVEESCEETSSCQPPNWSGRMSDLPPRPRLMILRGRSVY